MKVYEIILYREGEHVGTNFKCPRCGKYLIMRNEAGVVCPSCSHILGVNGCLWRIGIRQPPLLYFLVDIVSAYYQVTMRLVMSSEKRVSRGRSNNIRRRR